jgi:hypothetical protein
MNTAVTVKCPECSNEFPLSDAVLSSVRAGVAKECQSAMASREQTLAQRERESSDLRASLEKRKSEIEQEAHRLAEESIKRREGEIRAEAARSALHEHEFVIKRLRLEIDEKATALKQAQANELDLLKQKRELEEAKETLELRVQRTLDQERGKITAQARAQAVEESRLKIAEKEKVITDLHRKLDEAQRRAEQGSQQCQGEILEIEFERQLREAFPFDLLTEISKGIRGADVSQEVRTNVGRPCGLILYENKRTKNWSDTWIPKLKADMLSIKADIGVIVTEALPADADAFCQKDGIWVTDPKSAIPLAHVLRCLLQEVAIAKGHTNGAKEKMQLLYAYLTGNEFRQRVCSVIDAFRAMREDLDAERRALTKHWCKREKQINAVVENMAAMVGEVQGLSGNVLTDIPTLELDHHEEQSASAQIPVCQNKPSSPVLLAAECPVPNSPELLTAAAVV